ncbi:MAG: flagellar protein FlaG [Thiobacillus sp.]
MIVLSPPLVNQAQPDMRVSAAPVRTASSGTLAADVTAPADAEPTPEELRQVVSRINLALQQTRNNLEFSIDTDANQTVVKLVDTSTGQLIRQFPSAATLELSRSIELSPQGLLVKREA